MASPILGSIRRPTYSLPKHIGTALFINRMRTSMRPPKATTGHRLVHTPVYVKPKSPIVGHTNTAMKSPFARTGPQLPYY